MSNDDILIIKQIEPAEFHWPKEARTRAEALEIMRLPCQWLTIEQLKLIYPDKE